MPVAWLNQKRRWLRRDRLNPEPRRWDMREPYGAWLTTQPWDWFGTFTFAAPIHPEQAARCYDRWATALQVENRDEMQHARAMEYQKNGVVHFHALISGVTSGPSRAAWMTRWQDIAGGFAWILVYHPGGGAAQYLGKYVAKNGEVDLLRFEATPPRAKRKRDRHPRPFWEQMSWDRPTPSDSLADDVRRGRLFAAIRKLTTHARNCRPCGDAGAGGEPAAPTCTPGQALASWCWKWYVPLDSEPS